MLGLSVRCVKALQRCGFNGDGRTDRASLQGVVTDAVRLDTIVRYFSSLLAAVRVLSARQRRKVIPMRYSGR